jgi:hypothetical protein
MAAAKLKTTYAKTWTNPSTMLEYSDKEDGNAGDGFSRS